MSISQRVSSALAFSVVAGTLSLFAIQIADGTQRPHHGQTELACAKAKLEAMWKVELPEGAEITGSVPGSRPVSSGWDLKELGCSGAIHPTATLDEIFGAGSPSGLSYTAEILSGLGGALGAALIVGLLVYTIVHAIGWVVGGFTSE